MLTETEHTQTEPRTKAQSLLLGRIRLAGQMTLLRRWLTRSPANEAPAAPPVCMYGPGGDYRRAWPNDKATVGAAAAHLAAENNVCLRKSRALAKAIQAAWRDVPAVCLGPEGLGLDVDAALGTDAMTNRADATNNGADARTIRADATKHRGDATTVPADATTNRGDATTIRADGKDECEVAPSQADRSAATDITTSTNVDAAPRGTQQPLTRTQLARPAAQVVTSPGGDEGATTRRTQDTDDRTPAVRGYRLTVKALGEENTDGSDNHAATDGDTDSHPRLSPCSWLFPDLAGDRRLAGAQQSNRLRARRGSRKKRHAPSRRQAQRSLFTDLLQG